MSILLTQNIFIAGAIKGPTDGTLVFNAAQEAEFVNRGVAKYVIKAADISERMVPLFGVTDHRGITSGILGYNGNKSVLKMIVAGHSQAEHHAAVGTTIERGYNMRGPGCSACLQSGGTLEISSLAGVGGDTTAKLLVRLPEILTRAGEVVLLLIGVNDFSSGNNVPMATIKANLVTIWKMIHDAGKIPEMCLLTAVDSVANTTLVAAKAGVPELNAWIMDYARQNPWLLVADIYTPTVDPLTGKMKAANTPDGLHLSAAGGWDAAPGVLAPLKYILQPRVGRVASNEDSRKVNATSTQALPNPMFISTAGTGTLTGTYVAGSVMPDDWNSTIVGGTPTVTLSPATPLSGIGNGLRVQVTAAGSSEISFQPILNVVNTPVAGEYYQATADFDMTSSAGLTGLVYTLRRNINGVSTPVYATENAGTTVPVIKAGPYTFTTTPGLYSAGTVSLFGSRLVVYFGSGGGSCDFVLSRPEVRLVTP